ncbi:MAG: ATP-grasp domain-containing protein [Deltaproteobacteria bacterium]|nr:ATP-grasp domain-containing protein [Deltaproteobacteria bacterium]
MWIVVLPGVNPLSVNLYKEAKKRDINIAALSQKADNIDTRFCDKHIVVNAWTLKLCVEAIFEAKIRPLLAVIPINETYSHIAESISYKLCSTHRIFNSKPLTDSIIKNKLRNKIESNDYFPSWQKVSIDKFRVTIEQALNQFASVVVKPIHGCLSIGTTVVRSSQDLDRASNNLISGIRTLKNYIISPEVYKNNDTNSHFILEEYIDSKEYVIDGIISLGNVVFASFCEKSDRSQIYNEDRCYFTPCDLSKEIQLSAYTFIHKLAQTYPTLVSGFHAEFRIKDNKVKFIDIGLRVGGSGLSDLIYFYSTGNSIFGFWINSILGNKLKPNNSKEPCFTMLYLGQVRAGGIVTKLRSTKHDAIAAFGKIMFEHKFCNIGDKLSGLPNYSGHPSATIIKLNKQNQSRASINKLLLLCEKHLNPIYQ